jgi:hypothetical protein
MKRHTALLSLAVFIAFAAVQTSATTPTPTLSGTKTPEAAPRTQSLKSDPAAVSATGSANPSHLFAVNDAKGLLLTCIAPEIDTNPDTDMFKSCTLAPGRTLDDIQGIHYEQSEHRREREEWQKALEEKTIPKPAQKQ